MSNLEGELGFTSIRSQLTANTTEFVRALEIALKSMDRFACPYCRRFHFNTDDLAKHLVKAHRWHKRKCICGKRYSIHFTKPWYVRLGNHVVKCDEYAALQAASELAGGTLPESCWPQRGKSYRGVLGTVVVVGRR